MGYTAGDLTVYHNQEVADYRELDEEKGNMGRNGEWAFEVTGTFANSSEGLCILWANGQDDSEGAWCLNHPPCPCSQAQATSDWHFSFDHTSRTDCAVLIASNQQSSIECCYDDQGALVLNEAGAGSCQLYDKFKFPTKNGEEDSDPYQDCCVSSRNCSLYFKHRPSKACDGYLPPTTGMDFYTLRFPK